MVTRPPVDKRPEEDQTMTTDNPAGQSTPQPEQPADLSQQYRQAYAEKLAAAITVLTDAARIPRPRLKQLQDGTWVDDPEVAPEQNDWAEFVTAALAGAAANIGGIDAILNGRPGSWEAKGLRQILTSTVGHDEEDLWGRRTEPIDITIYVDEIIADSYPRGALTDYDESVQEISERWDQIPEPDLTPYQWRYTRDVNGELVSTDAGAPAWDIATWREQNSDLTPESRDRWEAILTGRLEDPLSQLGTAADPVPLWKSAEAKAEGTRIENAYEEATNAIGELDERLEAQRLREWAAYGEALKTRVAAAAAAKLTGLQVPVNITVDTTTYRRSFQKPVAGGMHRLEDRLIEFAILDTPTPADLPGTPLQRLEQATTDSDHGSGA